jgi:hypothetical protein
MPIQRITKWLNLYRVFFLSSLPSLPIFNVLEQVRAGPITPLPFPSLLNPLMEHTLNILLGLSIYLIYV